MKIILPILAVAVFICLQGCATITKGKKDTVQVQVSNCSEPMDCTATNKKGSWPFTAPGPVTFKKSDEELIITCNDGNEVITQRMRPTKSSMVWGNILIGGIIGGGVDASTDAHWEMTDSLLIYRNNCGQNNLSSSSQRVQPSSHRVQSSSHRVQSSSHRVQSSSQGAQPSSQKVQGSQAAGKPSYVDARRPSRPKEVDARDKDDCELITSITRNTGGSGDVSNYIKSARNSALTEAANSGADSYFIVNTESTINGASVTLEALNCN